MKYEVTLYTTIEADDDELAIEMAKHIETVVGRELGLDCWYDIEEAEDD